MRKIKKYAALLAVSAALALTGCGDQNDAGGSNSGNGGNGEAGTSVVDDSKSVDFTYMLSAGIETTFYEDYEYNPVMQYYLDREWDADGDGVGRKINIDFWTPPSGGETDYVNNRLSTGEYSDIMSTTWAGEKAGELYEDGIIIDITGYVEKYMPNYQAYLDRHPELKDRVTNLVDGEKKYIQLYAVNEAMPDAWGGLMYRRDWIVKYGVNPDTGAAFTGQWVEGDWVDDVVFPSGNADPIYISDWEWMLDIFATALGDMGITDGYPMSMYYPGYYGTGDIISAFGGGTCAWYIDQETGDIAFGACSEGFRAYLECMAAWYANGWIDKAFAERASDMFFMIDTASVYTGKVGTWYGTMGSLGNGMDSSGGDTSNPLNGIVVYAAPQPINDIYGSDAVKNVEPYTYYAGSLLGESIVFTDKCKDKDLATLFTALDYLYSDEGAKLITFGFSDEQQALLQNEWYNNWGLTKGAYSVVETEDGVRNVRAEALVNDSQNLAAACNMIRMIGLTDHSKTDYGYPKYMSHGLELWSLYNCTGSIGAELTGQMTADETDASNLMMNNVNTYMFQMVPEFIMGGKDILNDAQWQEYCDSVEQYNPSIYTNALQRILKGE